MEYSNPETIIQQQMESTNSILGNPLLLAAILLFLAILPRALRHILSRKEKTTLDRMVERFEKEELETAVIEDESDESIPPFPIYKEAIPVKIVKEGVPISHNDAEDSSLAPQKKVKLVKQGFSIDPDNNEVSSKKTLSERKGNALTQEQTSDSQESPISESKNEEPNSNWVEAEIPGLIMDIPPEAEKAKNVPTFKASKKAKRLSDAEKSQKPPQKEKQSPKVKNIAPKSEETKDSKPKKDVKTKAGSPKIKIEISKSKPKPVEIKAPIVSHKDTVKKEAGQRRAKAPSAKAGKVRKTKPQVAAVPPQRKGIKASDEKVKPKPFLLDLKYIDQAELEMVNPIAQGDFSADMMDAVIARLNDLQVDLEDQWVSTPGELTSNANPINGEMLKDRDQNSSQNSEDTMSEPSDKKEVSLDELDSFLFTASQRKK